MPCVLHNLIIIDICLNASWEIYLISLNTGSKIVRHLHKAWLHSNILVLKQKYGFYIYLYKNVSTCTNVTAVIVDKVKTYLNSTDVKHLLR